MNTKKYKLTALIGIIIMGIGSFMACLATTATYITIGNVMLILSLVITTYAFSYWQP